MNYLCALSTVIWTVHYFFPLPKPDMVNLILTSLSFTKFQASLNTTTVQLEHTRVLRWLEYKARVNCWAVPLVHYVIASPLRIYMRIVIFHFIHQIQAARIVLKLAHSCSQYNSITIYTRRCFVICCFVIQFRLSIFNLSRSFFWSSFPDRTWCPLWIARAASSKNLLQICVVIHRKLIRRFNRIGVWVFNFKWNPSPKVIFNPFCSCRIYFPNCFIRHL